MQHVKMILGAIEFRLINPQRLSSHDVFVGSVHSLDAELMKCGKALPKAQFLDSVRDRPW